MCWWGGCDVCGVGECGVWWYDMWVCVVWVSEVCWVMWVDVICE